MKEVAKLKQRTNTLTIMANEMDIDSDSTRELRTM